MPVHVGGTNWILSIAEEWFVIYPPPNNEVQYLRSQCGSRRKAIPVCTNEMPISAGTPICYIIENQMLPRYYLNLGKLLGTFSKASLILLVNITPSVLIVTPHIRGLGFWLNSSVVSGFDTAWLLGRPLLGSSTLQYSRPDLHLKHNKHN